MNKSDFIATFFDLTPAELQRRIEGREIIVKRLNREIAMLRKLARTKYPDGVDRAGAGKKDAVSSAAR